MAKPLSNPTTITDMAHGTPLGIGDNDKRTAPKARSLIEAGISSSYHIANFFGLTEWNSPVDGDFSFKEGGSKPKLQRKSRRSWLPGTRAGAGSRRGALAADDC